MNLPHRFSPAGRSRACLALVLAVALWGAVGAAAQFYPVPTLVTTDGGPRGIATGFFDGDGIYDLVTSNTVAGRILIHRGRADGSFRLPVSFPIGGTPSAFDAGDIDRDGLTDIVWANEESGEVGVIYQNQTTPVSYRVERFPGGDEPASILVWDENGDDWLDVVVAFRGGDAVGIFPNEAGQLGPLRQLEVGDGPLLVRPLEWPDPFSPQLVILHSGWLSRDVSTVDLASNPVSRFLGTDPRWFTLYDHDGDPWPDLVVLDAAEGVVQEWRGTDSAGFVSADSWSIEPNSERVELIDPTPGQRRWFVAESERLRISAYTEQGGNVLREASWFVGAGLRDWAWADTDRDGSDELLIPLADDDGVQVLRTIAGGLLAPEAIDLGPGPISVVRADEPGSGDPTVAVLCRDSDDVWVYDVTGNDFVLREKVAVEDGALRQCWHDIDANGRSDLAVAIPQVGIDVMRRATDGSYLPTLRIPIARDLRDLAFVDVEGSPATDLVVLAAGPAEVLVFEGDGAGGFSAGPSLALDQDPVRLRTRDLDLDSRDDLVVVGELSRVFLVFNELTGLRDPITFGVGDSPRDIGFGFFDDDALPDIVVANAGDQTFSVLTSVLPGVYSTTIAGDLAPAGAENVLVTDLDGNGLDDIILSSPSAPTISVHANSGQPGSATGTFTLPSRVRAATLPFALALCQVDGDGREDILIADLTGDVLVVLRTDPLSMFPPALVSLEAARQAGAVEIEVSGSAVAADQFIVRRGRDEVALRMARVAPDRWTARDHPPLGSREVYSLYDVEGRRLEEVEVSPVGVESAKGSLDVVLPARQVEGLSVLRFRLAGGTEPRVRVYDLRGRHVASLAAVAEGADWYRAVWNGADGRGRTTARGRYIVDVRVGSRSLRSSLLRP